MDDDSAGYAVHALNTVYVPSLERWIRFDARGNKPGVRAEFSIDREQLAFKIRPEYGEVDYLVNYAEPHPSIIETLVQNDDAIVMYAKRLPSKLD
jgi:transglutaminase-like putative cysteine protease